MKLTSWYQTAFILEVITWPTVGMTKISILLLYKRIFATPKFVTMVWILIGLVVAWTLSFTLALFCTLPFPHVAAASLTS